MFLNYVYLNIKTIFRETDVDRTGFFALTYTYNTNSSIITVADKAGRNISLS